MNNRELYEYCKRKLEEYTWYEIHKFLVKDGKITKHTTVDEIKSKYRLVAGNIAAGDEVDDQGSPYDKAFDEYLDYIKKQKGRTKPNPHAKVFTNHRRIVTISDIHTPHHDKEKIIEIFEKERAKGATDLVIAGDLMNCDSLSDHIRTVYEDFRVELAETDALLDLCSHYFPRTYVLNGNHDEDRQRRQFHKAFRPDQAALWNNPLDLVTKNKENVYRAWTSHNQWGKYAKQFAQEIGHTLIIGDALWSHLTFSGKDGKSVRSVEKWYQNWKKFYEFPEVNVFSQGHTHQLGVNYDYNTACIQTGCLVKPVALTYSMGSEGKGSPPCYGYVAFDQYDGKTDFGSIEIVKL